MNPVPPQDCISGLADMLRREWPDARIEVEQFPSGAAFLDVWRDGRFFVLRYTPSHRAYDVTEVTDEHIFDSGPCESFDELDPAAARLREIIAVPASHA